MISRCRLRAAVAGAVGALMVLVALWSRGHPYARAIVWSALLLASFVGWGSLVQRWVAPRQRVDWGLRAGWGMGLVLATGGYLSVVHCARRPVLILQVALGIAAWLAVACTGPRPRIALRRRLVVLGGRAGVAVLVVCTYAIAGIVFFGNLGYQFFNPSDDPPLYLALAEKLVQIGSFLEPFNARRVATLGGQVYLDASFVSFAPIRYLHAVDGGIALLVVVGLLVGHLARSGLKSWHAVPLGLASLLLFSLSDVRMNTGSLMSGVALFLTLYRTVRAPLGDARAPVWPMEGRRVAMLAVLTVCCAVLRTSNLIAALPFVAMVLASDFVLGSRWPWTRDALASLARTGGLFAGVLFLTLLPWSIMQEQSVGTFFFPLSRGNVTPGWTFVMPAKDGEEVATRFLESLFHETPIAVFGAFAVAGLVPGRGRARNDRTALTLAALLGIFVLSRNGGFAAWDMSRYYYAFVVAGALLVAASVGRAREPAGTSGAIVAAALATQLIFTREATRTMFLDHVKRAFAAGRATTAEIAAFDAPTAEYLDVQRHVAPGATIATAVFEDFRFDFERNPVYALDTLGGMGPKPGWPAYQGPDALGDYLRACGIDYLIWVDFNLPSEFYNREHWKENLKRTTDYLGGEARLQLDAEDAIEQLSAKRRIVYKAHGMTVVDLASPR